MAMMMMPVRRGMSGVPQRGLRGFQPRGARGFGMRGMGAGTSADAGVTAQLANESSYDTGYYASPAFLASQAATLQANCAASPNDPSCQVAQATGDITQGYNPVADTTLNITDYCIQNQQNNAIFGTALDTANCMATGGVNASTTAAIAAAAANSQITPEVLSQVAAATPADFAALQANPIIAPSQAQTFTTPPVPTPSTTITNQPSNSTLSLVNTPAQAQAQAAAGANNVPAAGASANGTFASAETWVEQNWIYLAAGVAALVLLPSLLKS